MTARVCEQEGCEATVKGRSKRCPEHQAEHRRAAESARKRQARNADTTGANADTTGANADKPRPYLSASTPVSEAATATAMKAEAMKAKSELRKAAAAALKRAGLPKDLIERTKNVQGTPFKHQEAFAKLSNADRVTLRQAFKEIADFPNGEFDKLTRAGDANGDGKQGKPVTFEDPEPWPEPVDGAALLDDLVARLEHYVSLPKGGAVAVAVWALYTWCFRAFSVSPYLMVTAPERESGKSRVTELLSWMVQRNKEVSDASAATIYRGVDRNAPTLLFDEAQTYLNRRPDDPIRGMLRSGFNLRLANVERMVGEGANMEERSFSTFCPKAMNGRNLVTLDDMLTSRSVVLPMTRATRAYPHLRADRNPVGEDIRRQCARWRDDHLSALREADPDVDTRIHRNADVWRPLFAVADAAGGEWPEKVRAAADALAAVAGTIDTGETLGTMLLADVRAVFAQRGDPDRIQSKALDDALRVLPERPWESMPKTGKAITAQARGRMLARYGVNAQTLRFDGVATKGYLRAAFADAWNAYLPEGDGDRTVEPLQSLETSTFGDPRTVAGNEERNGSESAETPAKQGTATVQRFGNRGAGREDAQATVEMPSQPPGTRLGDDYRRRRDGE